MVILTIAKLDNNRSSGLNTNIPKYVKTLNKYCQSGCLDCGNSNPINFKGFENYYKLSEYQEFSIKKLPKPFNKPDIVVFQSLYIKEYLDIAKELKKLNIPYTIIPRCSMTKAAQQKSFIKKIIGNTLFFNKFISEAAFIHLLTENEYKESNKLFKIKNKVIIGNGFDTPDKTYKHNNNEIFKVLYIGRYNIYHKGLDVLLKAIKYQKEYFEKNKFKFVFWGNDSDNGIQKIKEIIKKYHIEKLVEINNEIFGKEKEKEILGSNLFIHTSRLEGHPTSIIEAISYGIPVFVTPGTNVYEDVKNNNLGFVSKLNYKQIANKLIEAFENKNKYNKITENEIKFAKVNYNWENIAKKIIKLYQKEINHK